MLEGSHKLRSLGVKLNVCGHQEKMQNKYSWQSYAHADPNLQS